MTQRELGRFVGLVCGLWLCAGWFCASASATTITVNTTVDELNTNGNCSLREAIKSNSDGGGSFDNCPQGSSTVADVIVLQSAATYNLSRVGEDGDATNGDLDIRGDLIIIGNGATIDGNGAVTQDRVFEVRSGEIVDISNLTVTDGRAGAGSGILSFGLLTLTGVTIIANAGFTAGAAVQVTGNGGSATLVNTTISNNSGPDHGGLFIFSTASASLIDSTISGNAGGVSGGGIYNEGNLTLLRTRVTGNQAGTTGGTVQIGGGIYNLGTLTVTDSTIANNSADDSAGLINDGGTLTMLGSTLSGNTAISAGGMRNTNNGIADLVNSTISGNSANGGAGGLANGVGGNVRLLNVTVAFNTADADANGSGDGGGLSNSATLFARNSLIGENIDGSGSGSIVPDCSGALLTGGNTLVENVSGCTVSGNLDGNIIGLDPGLTGLANNGGPTLTHAFPSGAPPHNAGNANNCVGSTGVVLPTDQRGTAREQPTGCDIGAFELDNTIPTVLSVTRLDPSPTAAASVRFTVTFSEAVSGVDAPSDFALVQSGISNAAITDIAATSNRAAFRVTVSTGIGNGTLRLNVIDNNTIQDFALNGIVGGFAAGETYTIDRALALFANGFE